MVVPETFRKFFMIRLGFFGFLTYHLVSLGLLQCPKGRDEVNDFSFSPILSFPHTHFFRKIASKKVDVTLLCHPQEKRDFVLDRYGH